MKLSQFKYNLPETLIAKNPTYNRDDSRLMVLNRKDHTIEHKQFKDILDIFDENLTEFDKRLRKACFNLFTSALMTMCS